MKAIIVFITLSILLFGCTKRSGVKKLLTDDNHKFWDYNYKGYKTALFFHEDGRFYHYNYSAISGLRFAFHSDDVIVPDAWHLIGNDTLVMNGYKYKIIQLTGDSLKLVHKGWWNGSISCWKSPNQFFK